MGTNTCEGSKRSRDACPVCGGDGEVYDGPDDLALDDDGWHTCMLCGGSGHVPTDEEITRLREAFLTAQADLSAAELAEKHVRRCEARIRNRDATIRRLQASMAVASRTLRAVRECYDANHDGQVPAVVLLQIEDFLHSARLP